MIYLNKKSALGADFSETHDGLINSDLTSAFSINNQIILPSIFGDNFLIRGPAGNRTPKTLMLSQSLDHLRLTAFLT